MPSLSNPAPIFENLDGVLEPNGVPLHSLATKDSAIYSSPILPKVPIPGYAVLDESIISSRSPSPEKNELEYSYVAVRRTLTRSLEDTGLDKRGTQTLSNRLADRSTWIPSPPPPACISAPHQADICKLWGLWNVNHAGLLTCSIVLTCGLVIAVTVSLLYVFLCTYDHTFKLRYTRARCTWERCRAGVMRQANYKRTTHMKLCNVRAKLYNSICKWTNCKVNCTSIWRYRHDDSAIWLWNKINR